MISIPLCGFISIFDFLRLYFPLTIIVFLLFFSFLTLQKKKKKFCGGIFRVDDDDNDCDSGLVVAPDMLPRLYFFYFKLISFFLLFSISNISVFFNIILSRNCLFVFSFFFFLNCLSPIYYLAEEEKIGCSICTFHSFFFSLFCSMLWQFETVFTASKRRQERLLFFSDIVFWHAKFLCCFHPPTIFDIVSRFTF